MKEHNEKLGKSISDFVFDHKGKRVNFLPQKAKKPEWETNERFLNLYELAINKLMY